MRIGPVISLFFVSVSWAAFSGASQNTNVGGANSYSTINKVVVTERGEVVDVEITFTELVQPAVRRLEHPDRLVFDFAECEMAELGQRFNVQRGSIVAVSTEVSGVARPVASVIVELGSTQSHERAAAGKLVVSLSSDGNKLMIELGSAASSTSRTPANREQNPAAQKAPAASSSDRVLDQEPPKSAEMAPPMPAMPAGAVRSDHTANTSGPAVPPMPDLPARVLRSDLSKSDLSKLDATAVSPPPMADVPAPAVPPMPSLPPHAGPAERAALQVPVAAPRASPLVDAPQIARTAVVRVGAYALLDKARSLNISDLEPLETKAQAGDPEAQTTLALAYHAGTLLKLDDAEALRLLRKAADRGYVAAEESLAIFCQSGFGMIPDKAQAVSWYTKAARQGSRDAETNVALMYSTGDGVPRDVTTAATWFRSAAEAGDATAQLNIALLLHRGGEGVRQDDAQAIAWLSKAAEQGLLPAIFELARWELRPDHGKNVDAAIGWLKKGAEQGDATAEAELGDMFADPKIGRVDYAQAVIWYSKAAEQGQREAQYGLGKCYFLGQGVAQDMEEARRWLTPAANRGHPYAQFLLARLLEAGQGGPADRAAAAKYYEPAADYGIGEAQYRLGLLLVAGRRNGGSLVAAYKWLILAGSETAAVAKAQEVRKMLTAEQIVQAEHEIDEWRTEHVAQGARR
jgi:uncharacterized protein